MYEATRIAFYQRALLALSGKGPAIWATSSAGEGDGGDLPLVTSGAGRLRGMQWRAR